MIFLVSFASASLAELVIAERRAELDSLDADVFHLLQQVGEFAVSDHRAVRIGLAADRVSERIRVEIRLAVAARIPTTAASAPAFLKKSRREMSAINGSFSVSVRSAILLYSSRARMFLYYVAGKSSRFAGRRPLKGNRRRLLPGRFRRIGRVVGDVADLLVVQPDLQMRSLER